MLYTYQDKQTLCVTLEDAGEEAISKPVLNIIAFQPLLYGLFRVECGWRHLGLLR